MRGDHDELEIFLEICLIPSRIDQKLKNKGGNTWVFKGKISPKLWAVEAVVGAVLRSRGSDSLGPHRGFNFATNPLQFHFQSTTIGPRLLLISLQKQATIASISLQKEAISHWNNASCIVALIPRWKSHDRGSIAPRSRFGRTAIMEFFRESSKPSD